MAVVHTQRSQVKVYQTLLPPPAAVSSTLDLHLAAIETHTSVDRIGAGECVKSNFPNSILKVY